jgi:hypothetical protein
MNQGPRRISLMEKKEGQKSRVTIPLNKIFSGKLDKSGVLLINIQWALLQFNIFYTFTCFTKYFTDITLPNSLHLLT